MHHWIKWILGIVAGLLLFGLAFVFFFSHRENTAVFEQADTLSETSPSVQSTQTPDSPTTSPESFVEILPEDCNKECSTFQTSPDQYNYCRNVCGFSTSDSPVPITPPKDTKLRQDIEQKDTAIKEGNLSGCEAITDSNLRKACQVRVTEDLLD